MRYFMMQGMEDNYTYLGAPVKLKGQVVGKLCSGFMFPEGGVKKATPAQVQYLDKKARRRRRFWMNLWTLVMNSTMNYEYIWASKWTSTETPHPDSNTEQQVCQY
jgi:hypothetical protein